MSFKAKIERQNGKLRRFKSYSFSVCLPASATREIIEKVISLAEKEYGRENLMIHVDIKDSYADINFFRKNNILKKVLKISEKSGLNAEIFDPFSVGVTGDNRSYTPIVNVKGDFP